MIDDFARARSDRDGAYRAMLARVAPALHAMIEEGEQADELYGGCTRAFVRKAWGPGWALVGDAGIKKDPMTAQGISAAFECADKLAAALDERLSGRRHLDEALADYERERDARMVPYYEFTAQLSRFAKLTPEQHEMYRKLEEDPAGVRELFGVVTMSVAPSEFFAGRLAE